MTRLQHDRSSTHLRYLARPSGLLRGRLGGPDGGGRDRAPLTSPWGLWWVLADAGRKAGVPLCPYSVAIQTTAARPLLVLRVRPESRTAPCSTSSMRLGR